MTSRQKGQERSPKESEIVSGVVYPPGAGGASVPGKGWSLHFSLQPWKPINGPLHETEISISQPVEYADLDGLTEKLTSYRLVRVELRFLSPSQAQLVNVLDVDISDEELERHASGLQTPVTHQDSFFGPLILDRSIGCWETQVKWGEGTIDLSIDDELGLEKGLAIARTLWEGSEKWDQRVRDLIIKKLLPLKNKSWLDEDEKAVTAPQFLERIALKSITIDVDGELKSYWGDGNLFLGHSIVVSGTSTKGPTDADIAG